MKKTQEIIGLPIISISDGTEMGKAKSIIINADKGTIDYIVVDSGIQILSARVVATESLLGIGEYALTIENENAINDIAKIPAAIDLLQKNIQVKGTKVLTKKGRLIGETGDFFIDPANCDIIGLEYIADITQKKVRIIPRKSIYTFGKNLIIVEDNIEETLVDRIEELDSTGKTDESEKKNLNLSEHKDAQAEAAVTVQEKDTIPYFASAVEQKEKSDAEVHAVLEEEISLSVGDDTEMGMEALVGTEEHAGDSVQTDVDVFTEAEDLMHVQENTQQENTQQEESLFEQRQREYLRGRVLTKTILDQSGQVLAEEGTLISDEIIDRARQKGKVIDLVMNNKA